MDYEQNVMYHCTTALSLMMVSVFAIYFINQPTAADVIVCSKSGIYHHQYEPNENLKSVSSYCQVIRGQRLAENTLPADSTVAIPCSDHSSWCSGPCRNQDVVQMEEFFRDTSRKCGVNRQILEGLSNLNNDLVQPTTLVVMSCNGCHDVDYDPILSRDSLPPPLRTLLIYIYRLRSFKVALNSEKSLPPASIPRWSFRPLKLRSSKHGGRPALISFRHYKAWNSFSSLMLSTSAGLLRPHFATIFLSEQSQTPASALSLAPAPQSTGFKSCGICGNSYDAGIGETLASISKYCNVQLQQLQNDNPGIQVSNIAGKRLVIPCTGEDPADCSVCGSSIYIEQGDTLSTLADTCGIDLFALEAANPNIDYDNIRPGQFITLPCGNEKALRPLEGCGVCGITYTAVTNETINDVARACGTSVQELQNANPVFLETNIVLSGQIVNIPCNGNYTIDCGLCGTNYTFIEADYVQEDRMPSVALKCRVGVIALQLVNPGVTQNSVITGQVLNIPCQKAGGIHAFCSPCSPSVQVLANETDLNAVARRCNVSTGLLSYANSIDRVTKGQIISVPCATVGAPARNCSICGSSITLHALVSLVQLTEACSVRESDVLGINPALDLSELVPRDTLNLPCNDSKTDCGPCGIAYAGKASDTLQSLAVTCARMATQIEEVNPDIDFGKPLDGIVLTIPCGALGGSTSAAVILEAWELVSIRESPFIYFILNLLLVCFFLILPFS